MYKRLYFWYEYLIEISLAEWLIKAILEIEENNTGTYCKQLYDVWQLL